MTSRGIAAAIFVALGALVLPTAASAQSTIAGVVKDASGAVLPVSYTHLTLPTNREV